MVKKGVPFDELNESTKEALGLSNEEAITPSLSALGTVISSLRGLSTRDALWVLREMLRLIISEREKKTFKKKKAEEETVDN